MVRLRWRDVDLAAATVTVTGTLVWVDGKLVRQDTKTNAGRRVVPLVPAAVEALRVQRRAQAAERERVGLRAGWDQSGYVFTALARVPRTGTGAGRVTVGGPVDPRNALRWFYGVRDRAGIGEGSWHTLRHSAASLLLTSGVPMPVVSAVLGHASIAVTVDTYGHIAPSVAADAMAAAMHGYGRAEADSQSDSQSDSRQGPTASDGDRHRVV